MLNTAGNKGRLALGAAVVGVALALSGCAQGDPLSPTEGSGSTDTIVVGSQAYYSNEIVAEIYAQALENAGYDVERSFQIGQRDAYLPALEAGEVDVFPEYTGNLLQYYAPDTTATQSDEVYAALHRAPASRDEPVIVAEATPAAKDGLALPQEPVVPTSVQIDPTRLARLRLETAEVSSLLAGIFAEDEGPIASPVVVATTSARFEGLDVAHAELLGAVVDGGGLDRWTFEARAKALKLLPDGAIETINDWGFDRFDEPVLEGDEDLTSPEHLRLQLLALDLAA